LKSLKGVAQFLFLGWKNGEHHAGFLDGGATMEEDALRPEFCRRSNPFRVL
jgi:hypothetical protein